MAMQLEGPPRMSLLLVAKAIQTIANEATTGKDSNFKSIADFVETNRAAVYKWYDEFTDVSDEDVANLTPLVSHEEVNRDFPILARILVENYPIFFRVGYTGNKQFAVDLAKVIIGVQSPTSWSVNHVFKNTLNAGPVTKEE